MRNAEVFVNNIHVGTFTELVIGKKYSFEYLQDYSGPPVSLTMPVNQSLYSFDSFPPFFDGLLPEGYQLEGLLKYSKVDRNDSFSQLMMVCEDLVGYVTLKEIPS
ncbi:MAG TPA: HipA N-terminal domain-containing protein [Prolixibacteraceae bacterium]